MIVSLYCSPGSLTRWAESIKAITGGIHIQDIYYPLGSCYGGV